MQDRKMVAYYLPEKTLDNETLAILYPNWNAEKIYKKTGIKTRRIADKNEYTSDMAYIAAKNLLGEYNINKTDIDFIILVTQTPDYLLPTTACIIQNKLGISLSSGAFDLNLGCSGYVYGLAVAKTLIMSNVAKQVLLLTADVYTKFINDMDKSVRTLFGDGASATLINEYIANDIGNFEFGTDGSGWDKFVIPYSGARTANNNQDLNEYSDDNGNVRSNRNIYMDGAEIFNFTIEKIPTAVRNVLNKNNLTMTDIDLFVFHQANVFMLDHLKKIMKIEDERFYISMENIGNTVSSSIPIALKTADSEGILHKGKKVMLVGFGVGLSWGATIVDW